MWPTETTGEVGSAVQRVPSQSANNTETNRQQVPELVSQDMSFGSEDTFPQSTRASNYVDSQLHNNPALGIDAVESNGREGSHSSGARGEGANGGGGDGSGSDNGSVDGSSSKSEGSELPQVTVDMIPLRTIISRMVTFAYTELITLIETLPSRSESERRDEILKYTCHMRAQLTKLLVLVRWARNAPQIQKCQNVIAYLQQQNEYFSRSVDGLYATFLALPQARVRNYDIENAVDVLTTGTYRQLPSAIDEVFVVPAKLIKRKIRETLRAIDGIIRARILRGEAIPVAMRKYKIGAGRITFTVASEFEATLTLLQYTSDIPWHVVNVKILVGSDKTLPDEQRLALDTRQLAELAQHCQAQLLLPQQTELPPQLVRLYDFLHVQSLTLFLETLAKQAAALRRSRWENLLHVDMSGDRSSLTIRYWTSSRAAAMASGASPVVGDMTRGNSLAISLRALPVPRPIHASATGGAGAEFDQIERDRRNLIPKVGLRVTWTMQTGLPAAATWSHTVSSVAEVAGTNMLASDEVWLIVDPAHVNVERLLRQVMWQHSRHILKALCTSVVASKLFEAGAVELLFASPSGATQSEDELSQADIEQATVVPRLRAWYRQDEGAVDIAVDAFTGRLTVRAAESVSAALSEAMIAQLADNLNRTPWRLAELLVDMRSSLALADLDRLAYRSLGLRPLTTHRGFGPALPGFALSSVLRRGEPQSTQPVAASSVASPAMTPGPSGAAPQHTMAAHFPLRVSQQEADALVREVAGADQPLGRVRFYSIEGTEGEWYLMAAMAERLVFRIVQLVPHTDALMSAVGHVIPLQVDRLFFSVARRLAAEQAITDEGHTRAEAINTQPETERVDAMLSGRTSITLDYLDALASACRARLALRVVQTQLTQWQIAYSFRIPSFSTSPHGHRAAVSQELSVVELDKMGLYELDSEVPTLYIPIAALMRASPVNWGVASHGVLPDEARRMVSIRVASDELDPSPRSALSPSTRVDQRRQAALAAQTPTAPNSLIGKHVIPCQIVASIPVALDGLPPAMTQALADAVYFGAHAAHDGGYHSTAAEKPATAKRGGGYSKMVFVYKQVARALQCLIRDWSELHMMTHVARQLHAWEQWPLRRLLASTEAFYPFSAGPYTSAVANMLRSWRGHQSTELVLQLVNTYFLSVSCRVPFPFADSQYPPGFDDSGGSGLTYHLTLAEVDSKTGEIVRIGSTWPWVFARGVHDDEQGRARLGFEVSLSMSRWLRTLQARINVTGNPLSVLSVIVQFVHVVHFANTVTAPINIRSLSPSLRQHSVGDADARLVQILAAAEKDASDSDIESSQRVFSQMRSLRKGFDKEVASVSSELDVQHMYTAADNLRLVFNSRYVVDIRLVSGGLFHISDVVASSLHDPRSSPTSHDQPPQPLVRAAMEPIPMFSQWLAALTSVMRLDWTAIESLYHDAICSQRDDEAAEPSEDRGARIRAFQRNIHRLRPDSTTLEKVMNRFHRLFSKQNSTRSPPFVPLPGTSLVCTAMHLNAVLLSLIMWILHSVHVVDAMVAAVTRIQALIASRGAEPAMPADGEGAAGASLFAIDELLVDKMHMVVGFTGSRGSVRCEFVMQMNMTEASNQADELLANPKEPLQDGVARLYHVLKVPENIFAVRWSVRILPILRPPKGITERAAAALAKAFGGQGRASARRAVALVKLLSLPPHLLEDTVQVSRDLVGKVEVLAIEAGDNYSIRLDVARQRAQFALRFEGGERAGIMLQYSLRDGNAAFAGFLPADARPAGERGSEQFWRRIVGEVIAKLDDMTAFTPDMGRDGKSRWFEIVAALYKAQCLGLE